MRSRTVTVDVEVDLSDFETEDLEEELKVRGKAPLDTYDTQQDLQEIYYALKFGQNDRALELTRTMTCNVLGRVL